MLGIGKKSDQPASASLGPVDPTRVFYAVEKVAEESRAERLAEAKAEEEAEMKALELGEERGADVAHREIVPPRPDEVWI